MSNIKFNLHKLDGVTEINMNYDELLVIGYAGRDMEKTMEHIKELEEELGVAPPKKIPTIFQCSNLLLTQDEDLEFVGNMTSGEVEYVIVLIDGKVYIGIGSDHTDRDLESVSVLKSKQVCAKPIGLDIWDYEDVKDHWDDIKLNSIQTIDGEDVAYQAGSLADILVPEKILEELYNRVGDIKNSIIFSGTVPLADGFKYGQYFKGEMVDHKLNRKLTLNYKVIEISEEER